LMLHVSFPDQTLRRTAKLLVFDQESKLLILRKTRGGWDLPGGRGLQGEPIEACLRREVREELGLEAPDDFWLVHRWVRRRIAKPSIDVHLFAARLSHDGTGWPVALSSEHEALEWIGPERIWTTGLPLPYCQAVASALAAWTQPLAADLI
jgi:8-oxo-dGTP pyrophosphatase MutT (NUDIX family)